ncbi:hypothetical protein VTO42DRAFT_8904 [Malbranchea cinnamomea]
MHQRHPKANSPPPPANQENSMMWWDIDAVARGIPSTTVVITALSACALLAVVPNLALQIARAERPARAEDSRNTRS